MNYLKFKKKKLNNRCEASKKIFVNVNKLFIIRIMLIIVLYDKNNPRVRKI